MSFLNYIYSTGLTPEEQIEIDEKTKTSREAFRKGFCKGAAFSLAAYSVYSWTTSAAYASDIPETPGDLGAGQPAPTVSLEPEFQPLAEPVPSGIVGGLTALFIAPTQFPTMDYRIGVLCAIVGGGAFVMLFRNRHQPQPPY